MSLKKCRQQVTAKFGRLKQDFFKQFLELPNGIPDESTFRKVLSRLEPGNLHKSLDKWHDSLNIRALRLARIKEHRLY